MPDNEENGAQPDDATNAAFEKYMDQRLAQFMPQLIARVTKDVLGQISGQMPAQEERTAPVASTSGGPGDKILDAIASDPKGLITSIIAGLVEVGPTLSQMMRKDDLTILTDVHARNPHYFGLFAPNAFQGQIPQMLAQSWAMGARTAATGKGGGGNPQNPFVWPLEPSGEGGRVPGEPTLQPAVPNPVEVPSPAPTQEVVASRSLVELL